MAGITIKDGRHFIALVTGPSHVLLGIRFGDTPSEPRLVALPARDGSHRATLDAAMILDVVQQTLAAHRAAGNAVFAEEIVYVSDDSPRADLYRIAAERLVAHHLAGGGAKAAE